jgi:hypothetical protein
LLDGVDDLEVMAVESKCGRVVDLVDDHDELPPREKRQHHYILVERGQYRNNNNNGCDNNTNQ